MNLHEADLSIGEIHGTARAQAGHREGQMIGERRPDSRDGGVDGDVSP
jgi:hypothetical protein